MFELLIGLIGLIGGIVLGTIFSDFFKKVFTWVKSLTKKKK